jgi:sodium pump decarboxylase gamma subunit
MLEGLLISVIGMFVVFVVLTILMFVIIGLERLFRHKEVSEVAAEMVAVEQAEPPKEVVRPGDTAEVAAIALALTSYLKERGKKLEKPLAIDGAQYQVEIDDISRTPMTVVVDGDSYRAAVGEEGLPPTEQIAPVPGTQRREPQRGLGWRSIYPPSQGGFWNRRGWTSKGSR